MNEPAMRKKQNQPRYVLLSQQLAKGIRDGKYPVDSLLPTEAELTKNHNVSRFTVREAIRQLQEQGLVVRRQGVGTRVIAAEPAQRYTHGWSSVEELLQYKVESVLNEMERAEVRAEASLADLLQCAEGDEYLRLSGFRVPVDRPDGPPVCWTDIYVAEPYAEIRDEIGVYKDLIANLIESRYGTEAAEIRQNLTSVSIPDHLAEPLGLRRGAPALRVQRWYIGTDGKPFEVTISLHPGDRFSYSMQLRRNGDM